jgi:lipopolysaccharide transport system permease protein
VIGGFRWAVLGAESELNPIDFPWSYGIINFSLWLGIRQFRKMELSFADLI